MPARTKLNKNAGQPVTTFRNTIAGACTISDQGINREPTTTIHHPIMVRLSGRSLIAEVVCTIGTCPTETSGGVAMSGKNCCFTAVRVKNTSHQIPIPANEVQNNPMTIRTSRATDVSIGLFGADGKGTIREIKAANPLMKISKTENAIMERRAQLLSRNNPMLVKIPHIAGSTYVSEANTSRAVMKVDGIPVGKSAL